MIETVIFDLDDTLYDEIEYCRSGFSAVGAYLGKMSGNFPPESIEAVLWKHFNEGDRKRVFNAALDELGIDFDSELITELVRTYREHKPKIRLEKKSEQVLAELKNIYTLALLTDGFLPAQRLKVEALGIGQYFRSIVYTEQLGREFWKPCPVGFERILADLTTPAERAVYVADNEKKDFIGPNQLGMQTVKLVRPAGIHREKSQYPDSRPGYVINEIEQLAPLLERI